MPSSKRNSRGLSSYIARTSTILICATLWATSRGAAATRHPRHAATRRSSSSVTCKSYKPSQCALVHGEGPAHVPYCHKGDGVPRTCAFDTKSLKECPLPANGTFQSAERVGTGGDCSTAFMSMGGLDAPECGRHCCSAYLAGAPWHWQSQSVHQVSRAQDAVCRYHEYTWREALDCLAGSRLVIAGDSIMRQLFNAGIALFRGQVAIDYNKHAHGRYRVCETADALRFSSFKPERFEVPLPEVARVFASEAREDGWQCPEAETFDLDYLWAPKYTDLADNLLEFHRAVAAVRTPPPRLVYVVFAGFWEDQQAVPPAFLAALDAVRAAAQAVVLVGVPRTRLYGWKKDNALVRNNKTQAWVESRAAGAGANVHYLDFDQLAHLDGAPEAIGSLNWHYQCFLDHAHLQEAAEELGGLGGAWHWDGFLNYTYPTVWTDDGAQCEDTMDASLWQILFNVACNARPDGRREGSQRHRRPAAVRGGRARNRS